MEELINLIGLETIISGLLAVLAAVFGGKLAKLKRKFKQAIALGNQLSSALADNKITKEEMTEIRNAWNDFVWWKS